MNVLKSRSHYLVLAILAGFALSYGSEPKIVEVYSAKVVGITDGDTIKVLDSENDQHRIRLEGIDAPEDKQAYSAKSRKALADAVAGKMVKIKKTGEDRYKRTLAFVEVEGIDVNAKMIEDGWAWHFKKYNQEERLAKLENEARAAKRGLWADAHPIPPWEYRDNPTPAEVVPGGKPSDGLLMASAISNDSPQIKDSTQVVYITDSGKKYHNTGCSSLSKSRNEITLQEAVKRGYTACSKCKGKTTSKASSSAPNVSATVRSPNVSSGTTPSGKTIYTGPRGGRYHYSASGKKVYERKKK